MPIGVQHLIFRFGLNKPMHLQYAVHVRSLNELIMKPRHSNWPKKYSIRNLPSRFGFCGKFYQRKFTWSTYRFYQIFHELKLLSMWNVLSFNASIRGICRMLITLLAMCATWSISWFQRRHRVYIGWQTRR